jgi:hypothetical protein
MPFFAKCSRGACALIGDALLRGLNTLQALSLRCVGRLSHLLLTLALHQWKQRCHLYIHQEFDSAFQLEECCRLFSR